MKRVFRYKQSSIAIMLGLIIAFLGMFYGDYLYQLRELEEAETDAFSYQDQYAFSIVTSKDFNMDSALNLEALDGLLQQESVTVMTDMASLYVDAQYAEHLCYIVFAQGAGLKFHLCEGRYPTAEELEAGEPVAVLGRSMKSYTYRRDGSDYILIAGEEYRVTGYCSGKRTTITNYQVLLFYPCLGRQARQDFLRSHETYSITMVLCSDGGSVNPLYEAIKEGVEQQGLDTGGLTEYPFVFSGGQYNETHRWYSYLIYGFSLFITIVVLQYWIYQRTFEFAIRRICGYTRIQLVRYIGRELGLLLLSAALIAGILYGGIGLLYYFLAGTLLSELWLTLLRTLGIIAVTFILLMLYPLWNIYHQQALDAYRNG